MVKKKNVIKMALVTGTLVPVTVLAILIIFVPQPSSESIMNVLFEFYARYGYLIVFLGAFIESLLLINFYLPGSTAVLLGAVLASRDVLYLPLVILISTIGILLAYFVDYILGKHGWYKLITRFGLSASVLKTKKKLNTKRRRQIIFLSCLHPNTGAISATGAGIIKLDIKEFFIWFGIAQLYWSTFWAVLFYSFGYQILDVAIRYFSYTLLIILLIWTFKRLYRMRSNTSKII